MHCHRLLEDILFALLFMNKTIGLIKRVQRGCLVSFLCLLIIQNRAFFIRVTFEPLHQTEEEEIYAYNCLTAKKASTLLDTNCPDAFL